MTDIDNEQLSEARKVIAHDLGKYADGFASTEGGLVTAFVVVAEVAAPDGGTYLFTVAAAGPDGERGLQAWQHNGMLQHALDLERPKPRDWDS